MAVEIVVKGSDAAEIARRRTVADRVVGQVVNPVGNQTLLCFLDDDDCVPLKEDVGVANRGVYWPVVNGDPFWVLLPEDVRWYILFGGRPINSPPSTEEARKFDHLIYLHGSTCSNDIGLTMTFAHELQHFVQHETARRLWAENTLAAQTLRHLDMAAIRTLGIQWCDVPIEREAKIVAKRAAVYFFGTEAVARFIDGKIAELVTEQDAADWKCIRGLDVSAPYDLAAATKAFFPRLRGYTPQLRTVLQHLSRSDQAFSGLDVDGLVGGERIP